MKITSEHPEAALFLFFLGWFLFGLVLIIEEESQPLERVQATVSGVNTNRNFPKTYVIDEHGHRAKLVGAWGQVGDTIQVSCNGKAIDQ